MAQPKKRLPVSPPRKPPVLAKAKPASKKPTDRAEQEKLVWKRDGRHGLAELERLSESEQRQFLAAATKYRRGPYASPRAFAERFARESGEPLEKVWFERWQVALASAPKTIRYTLWTFDTDNGTVFEHGKATPSGVHLVQGGFEATDAKKESIALAAAMNARSPI